MTARYTPKRSMFDVHTSSVVATNLVYMGEQTLMTHPTMWTHHIRGEKLLSMAVRVMI